MRRSEDGYTYIGLGGRIGKVCFWRWATCCSLVRIDLGQPWERHEQTEPGVYNDLRVRLVGFWMEMVTTAWSCKIYPLFLFCFI